MPRPKTKSKCHPEKGVHGNGLCVNCYHNKWARDNPVRTRKYQRSRLLKGTYGMTLEDYERILEEQNYGCAICERTNGNRLLFVDHDHKTGVVRGLLCHPCNLALGHFRDDIGIIEKAIKYLTNI